MCKNNLVVFGKMVDVDLTKQLLCFLIRTNDNDELMRRGGYLICCCMHRNLVVI